MKKLEAWLNQVPLSGIGRILIQDIRDSVPETEITYGDSPDRMGQRLLARRRISRRVEIVFAVRELNSLPARSAIVDRVNAWARDGILEVGHRPGQQLRVLCAARAAIQKPRDYTEEFTIAFDAAAWPYWEDIGAEKLTMSGQSGAGTLANRGTMDSYISGTVTPTGGTLNTLTITAGDTSFALAGLNVASGAALTIAYDERGLLLIRAGNEGLLSCRSEESSDDLVARPGRNAVSFTANTACDVTLEVRGSWL